MNRLSQLKIYKNFFYRSVLLLNFVFILGFLSSCFKNKEEEMASLIIQAKSEGTYDIYKIEEGFSFELAKKYLGSYNKKLTLPLGDYIILTECSSKRLLLHSKKLYSTTVHQLKFVSPLLSKQDNLLSVVCQKNSRLRMKNKLVNHYILNFFPGQKKIEVNKKIFNVDFSKVNEKEPQELSLDLSAVKVLAEKSQKPQSYFVLNSEGKEKRSFAQKLNHWSLLLPGKYTLEINGTKKKVELVPGGVRSFVTGSFVLPSSKKINQEWIIQTWGHPLTVYLNKSHMFFLNESLFVFPGEYTLNFYRSLEKKVIKIEAGDRDKIPYKTILVSSGCQKAKGGCFKRKDVLLYKNKEKVPFLMGHSDISLPYFTESLGLEFKKSKGIKYWVSGGKKDKEIKLSTVVLKPLHVYNPALETEFVRLESEDKNTTGFSQDLSYNRKTTMDLIAGKYRLVSYLKPAVEGGKREKIYHKIKLNPHKKSQRVFPYYLSKRKYLKLKKKNKLL